VLKGGKETEYARADLCAEIKQAISEQRRIDAAHAEARGSIPLSHTSSLGGYTGGVEVSRIGKEADVRLVLPLEPWKDKSKKGEKKKIERSFLKGSKNMFTDKGACKVLCDELCEFGWATSLPPACPDVRRQVLTVLDGRARLTDRAEVQ